MDMKFDAYTWRARVQPVYFTAAPAVLAVATTVPEGLTLPLGGASAIVFLSLPYFMGQVASDFGKRLEPSLWDSWDGPPTTRFLRHDNDEFNAATRKRIHTQLRALGLKVPTADEEESDREQALLLYDSAVDELRRQTRDSDRFNLLHKTNIEYGFRRNLLGLKPTGLAITTVALVATGWSLYGAWHDNGPVPPVPLVTTLLNSCVALGWLVGVRAKTVRLTAERYAQRLLEAALDLEPRT
ncbi:MAG: hypothetical protein F4Y77_00670 [Holophagales bacterium]|nr:hypothetical protein [Holophagales bacterium]